MMAKFKPVKQCFSAGRRIPYFSGISGSGTLFFSCASSSSNFKYKNDISVHVATLGAYYWVYLFRWRICKGMVYSSVYSQLYIVNV